MSGKDAKDAKDEPRTIDLGASETPVGDVGGIRSPILSRMKYQPSHSQRVGEQATAGAEVGENGPQHPRTRVNFDASALSTVTGASNDGAMAEDEGRALTFRNTDRPPYRVITFLLIAATLGFVGLFFYKRPEALVNARRTSLIVYHTVMTKVMVLITGIHPGAAKYMYREEDAAESVGVGTAAKSAVPGAGACDLVIDAARSKTRRSTGDFAGKVAVGECFLFKADPAVAATEMLTFRNMISRGDAKVTEPMIDGFHTYIESELKMWRVKDADLLTRNMCTGWEASPGCIGKLMVQAAAGATTGGESAFQNMKAASHSFGPRAETRVWIAGGRLASALHRHQDAEERLNKAAALAPWTTPYFGREILEARIENAYFKNDRKLAAMVVKKMREQFADYDRAYLQKTEVVFSLMGEQARKALFAFLTRGELNFKLRGDPGLFRIVSQESIRLNLSREYVEYLHGVQAQLTKDYQGGRDVLRPTYIWEIRALMATGEWVRSLSAIETFERTFGGDSTLRHLKGVTLLMSSPAPKTQLLAAKSFQDALKTDVNWQSMYGLGVAMIRAGHPERVGAIVGGMENKVEGGETSKWLALLKLELMLAEGKAPTVLSNLDRFIVKYPDSLEGWTLKGKTLTKLGKKADLAALKRAMVSKGLETRNWASREAQSNPIGPFARL